MNYYHQEIIIHLRNELRKKSMESHRQCNNFLKEIMYHVNCLFLGSEQCIIFLTIKIKLDIETTVNPRLEYIGKVY